LQCQALQTAAHYRITIMLELPEDTFVPIAVKYSVVCRNASLTTLTERVLWSLDCSRLASLQ
jgi:hypothetical protein